MSLQDWIKRFTADIRGTFGEMGKDVRGLNQRVEQLEKEVKALDLLLSKTNDRITQLAQDVERRP